jgi:ATP-binding cassette subfamily C protein
MLARALLRDPQLLILDEATSALDAANEAAIVAALRRLRGQMTMLLICHRGSLLELADQVVRLDAGRLVDET